MKRLVLLLVALLAASTSQAEMLLTTVSGISHNRDTPFHLRFKFDLPGGGVTHHLGWYPPPHGRIRGRAPRGRLRPRARHSQSGLLRQAQQTEL